MESCRVTYSLYKTLWERLLHKQSGTLGQQKETLHHLQSWQSQARAGSALLAADTVHHIVANPINPCRSGWVSFPCVEQGPDDHICGICEPDSVVLLWMSHKA